MHLLVLCGGNNYPRKVAGHTSLLLFRHNLDVLLYFHCDIYATPSFYRRAASQNSAIIDGLFPKSHIKNAVQCKSCHRIRPCHEKESGTLEQ